MISNYDFLTVSKYLYPINIPVSDILGVILFGYPEISFLSLKISMMMFNYDILVISQYIHVYPIQISVSDILGLIPLCYPVISVYILGINSFVLTWCSALFGLFLQCSVFFGSNTLPISINILSYPFNQPRGNNCILLVLNPVYCAY